jgi:hypothetical protein
MARSANPRQAFVAVAPAECSLHNLLYLGPTGGTQTREEGAKLRRNRSRVPREMRQSAILPELAEFKRRALASGRRRRAVASDVRVITSLLRRASRLVGHPITCTELFADFEVLVWATRHVGSAHPGRSRTTARVTSARHRAAVRAFLRIMAGATGSANPYSISAYEVAQYKDRVECRYQDRETDDD